VDLTGEDVMPLEEEIADTVQEFFPRYRQDYASIPMQLRSLDLPGEERAEELLNALSEIAKGSAADAAARLGAEDAPLVEDIQWVRSVKQALDRNQIDEAIEEANRYIREIPELPSVEHITSLKQETKTAREQIGQILQREKFYEHTANLQSHLTTIENHVKETVEKVREAHKQRIEEETQRLQDRPEWVQMDADDQDQIANRLDELHFDIPPKLNGLQRYVGNRLEIEEQLRMIEEEIEERAKRTPQPSPGGNGKVNDGGGRRVVSFDQLPKEFSSVDDIDRVIDALQQLKEELKEYESIVIDW
jgi:DNA repair exonuclease SbcCD ATPase subunit